MHNSKLQFSIRFAGQKRGKVVRGKTVMDYLASIGLDPIMVGPNGGECGKGGEYHATPEGVRSYSGGTRVPFSVTL